MLSLPRRAPDKMTRKWRVLFVWWRALLRHSSNKQHCGSVIRPTAFASRHTVTATRYAVNCTNWVLPKAKNVLVVSLPCRPLYSQISRGLREVRHSSL